MYVFVRGSHKGHGPTEMPAQALLKSSSNFIEDGADQKAETEERAVVTPFLSSLFSSGQGGRQDPRLPALPSRPEAMAKGLVIG